VSAPQIRPKRTILFVHGADEMYGSDAILLSIVRALRGTEFEPFVVVPNDVRSELPASTRLSGRLKAMQVPVASIPLAVLRRKYFNPSGVITLWRRLDTSAREVLDLLGDRDVALVHSHTAAVFTGMEVARQLRVPHVWHVSEMVERPRIVRRLIARTVAKNADWIAAVSKAVRAHILQTYPAAADHVDVIYNGIDVTPFLRGSRDRIRREINAGERPVIGMIGRLGTWKGQELLLEAAPKVLARHPNALFFLVGGVFDGQTQHFDAIRELATKHGIAQHVIVHGFRNDIADVHAAMDVFVQPSLRPDPFPTTVLEAMASAKPVVATAHGGPCEMVVPGETGLLTEPGDADALADAIVQLLDNDVLRRRAGEAGRRRVMDEFSLQASDRRYLEMYRHYANARR
jgi:glycosyltransferase involved in cell wall biosynthesis